MQRSKELYTQFIECSYLDMRLCLLHSSIVCHDTVGAERSLTSKKKTRTMGKTKMIDMQSQRLAGKR